MSLLSKVTPVMPVLERPHGLLEGPRFGPGAALVYSDVIAGGVWECSADIVRQLLPTRRGIGGIVPHAEGGWVLSGRDLLHLAPGGEQRLLYRDDMAGFNDLGTTGSGELLAGVLRYRPLAGEQPRNGQLLRLAHAGAAEIVTDEIIWPNGIGVAADGETIYVSDYARHVVLAVSVTRHEVQKFCRSPSGSPDGLCAGLRGRDLVRARQGRWRSAISCQRRARRAGRDARQLRLEPVLRRRGHARVLISTADNRVVPERGGTLLRARSEVAGLRVSPATV